MQTKIELAVDIIMGLMQGTCWCGLGIGDPHYTSHSVRCNLAKRYVLENANPIQLHLYKKLNPYG